MSHKIYVFILSILPALLISVFAGAASSLEDLKIVENEKVCMVTDMVFKKKQIAVAHEGKTYYGCCENCKATLSKDAKARTAIDPVSGKAIDKAKAVIAAREDDSVVYFENRKSFDQYVKSSESKKDPKAP